MNYRPEIDGLRALAVLPVIFFHAGFQTVSGGYVGVDVFFVISGYLITSIILAEKQAGTFTLANFYERRARRILPALFVVMFACLPFSWLLMNPHQLKEFSQSLVAVSLFSSNVLFWKQSDYFDANSSLKPLLHTWSLGIEEQYYLFFPLLIIVAWRFGKGKLLAILLFIAASSLLFAQTESIHRPAAAFYLLPTRTWELLVGSFLAFGFGRAKDLNLSLSTRQSISLLGLGSIALSIILLDTKTPFPSVYALPTTLGAASIILFATKETYVGALLSSRFLVGIGLVSYSAYLWHQPILAFLKISNRSNELTLIQYFIYFALTSILAFATHRVIETPFRRNLLKKQWLFSASLAGSILFVCIGYVGHQTKGFLEIKLSEVPVERRTILVDVAKERNLAEALIAKNSEHLSQKSFDSTASSKKVLFIGDSMGRDLATAIAEARHFFPNHQIRLQELSNDCLYTSAKLDAVCLGALKEIYSSPLLRDADLVVVNFLWKEDADFSITEQILASVKASNPNILLLGSAGFIDMATVTYDLARLNSPVTQTELDKVVFDSRRFKFERGNDHVQKIAKSLDIRYFDRKDLYCNYTLLQCRIIVLGHGSILWDNAHLSAYGMKVTAEAVAETGLLDRN